MAPHGVSWGENGHDMPSVLSRRASIISVDSVLTDTHDGSLRASEAPSAAESRVKGAVRSLVIQLGGGRTHGGSYTGLMVRSYDTRSTSSATEMSHFWCVVTELVMAVCTPD
jgi:hypothetical protein